MRGFARQKHAFLRASPPQDHQLGPGPFLLFLSHGISPRDGAFIGKKNTIFTPDGDIL